MCYFDGFDYPLQLHEIHGFLPGITVSLEKLRDTLHDSPMREIVSHSDGYYYLSDRSNVIIKKREAAERYAIKRWRVAVNMTKLIKMFPYVRSVMISGDLSKNVSTRDSDIDYFILTEPGRLWIVRLLLTLFKKILLLNDRTYYCLNFYRTTDHLDFAAMQDHYTATEIFTLKSVYNAALCRSVIETNRWAYHFFPNYTTNGEMSEHSSERCSRVQIVLEKLLAVFPLDRMDTAIMEYIRKKWRKRYPALSEAELRYRFRCTKHESTAFVREAKHEIMVRHSERLRQVKKELRNAAFEINYKAPGPFSER
jgi:hypothetical protein